MISSSLGAWDLMNASMLMEPLRVISVMFTLRSSRILPSAPSSGYPFYMLACYTEKNAYWQGK